MLLLADTTSLAMLYNNHTTWALNQQKGKAAAGRSFNLRGGEGNGGTRIHNQRVIMQNKKM